LGWSCGVAREGLRVALLENADAKKEGPQV
jgi:hypothetical protein